MKFLFMIIIVDLLLSINCATVLHPQQEHTWSASGFPPNEPGFDCPGGIAGLLRKYLGQQDIAKEKVSLVILGHCVFDPEFNHRLARDIRRTATTVMTMSDNYTKRLPHKIFGPIVLYYCQDGLARHLYRRKVLQVEQMIPVRPYVLFTISNPSNGNFASVQYCRLQWIHRLLDKWHLSRHGAARLPKQIERRPPLKLCSIDYGPLQTYNTMMFIVKAVATSNCSVVRSINNTFLLNTGLMLPHTQQFSTALQEYSFHYQLICLTPLAIVEPSEMALIKPLSVHFIVALLGTILTVCLFVSLGFLKELKSLLYQVISSVVTPEPVVVPHSNGLFKFQRLLLMGLFVVLFQSVIVNNFKTEVTTELLEPKRDLKIFSPVASTHQNELIRELPARCSIRLLRVEVYATILSRLPVCYARPEAIQDGLRIPLVRSIGPLLYFGTMDKNLLGDILRVSKILLYVNQHGLLPMTRSYKGNSELINRLATAVPRKAAQAYHHTFVPASKWSPENHWEATRELLETCFGTNLCSVHYGTQKVLIDDADLSPVFRMKHLKGTIRMCSALLIISMIVFVGELIYKCVENAGRRRLSSNVRTG